jgi:hypothetical protein
VPATWATAIQALEGVYGKVGRRARGRSPSSWPPPTRRCANNAKAGEWVAKAVAAGNNSASLKQLQATCKASGDYGHRA